MRRWISWVRPLGALPRPSRLSRRSGLERGCIWYSAVSQPLPRPAIQGGTALSIEAVQSTTVRPAR